MLTGIVPVKPVRPIRRNSSVALLQAQPTEAPEPLPPIADLPEDTSNCFSVSGDDPRAFCHSRSHSIAVSTATDFCSCQDEREFQDRPSSPLTPFPMSLEEELEQIELDELAERMAASEGDQSSYLHTSWQR